MRGRIVVAYVPVTTVVGEREDMVAETTTP
jgi:hypothetical protein